MLLSLKYSHLVQWELALLRSALLNHGYLYSNILHCMEPYAIPLFYGTMGQKYHLLPQACMADS